MFVEIRCLLLVIACGCAQMAARPVSGENWNPFDKDSEVREGLRQIDPGPGIGDALDNDTRFHGYTETVQATTKLRNLGKSKFFGWSLDIDGKTGTLILNAKDGKDASGTWWEVRRDGKHNGFPAYTIRNRGKSDYFNYYLDIDGKTGALMLNKERAAGANWIVRSVGNYRGYKAYVIQNLAESPFRGHYLDIDGRKGTLMLNEKPASGIYWWFLNPPLEK
ncbi:hypothetical protein PLANPX_4120 [Lacipirellula parvula]|uniref:Ricin B lectin domain-containing protein n=2 Tax=Lacipirellula parvula TaxID=2650471 RepID=A0A5K7XDF1_9BACT|nr:hypothetical protein PLANPX_4120 [Lacipirellula parvula]